MSYYGYNSGRTRLRFRPRLKVYRNSTGSCAFDPATCEGRSYRWTFVKRINGLVVFNNYSYSRTTNVHQCAMRSLLRELKIKIDLEVDTRFSLDSIFDAGNSAIKSEIRFRCDTGSKDIYLEKAYRIAEVFGLRLTQKRIQEIITEKEDDRIDRYLRDAFERSEKPIREVICRVGGNPYAEFPEPCPWLAKESEEATQSPKPADVGLLDALSMAQEGAR